MNRHDLRRAAALKRRADKAELRIKKQIAKAAEGLAKQWVTEALAQRPPETA